MLRIKSERLFIAKCDSGCDKKEIKIKGKYTLIDARCGANESRWDKEK